MKRQQTAHRQLFIGVSVALLWLSIGMTAQRVVPDATPTTVVPEKLKGFVPVTDDMLLRPRPENWISFRNGYNLWGYSSLNQIHAANVRDLRLVWSRAMQPGPQEIEPIVYDGIMFLANAEDIVQALDATTGDLLWEYKRTLPPDIGRLTGTQYRYRNVSIFDNKLFLATNDAFQIALEAKDGTSALGEPARGLQGSSRPDDWPDRRQGQAHQRIALQSLESAPRRVLHHRPRGGVWRTAVAGQRHREAGRAGRRHVGRSAD